MRLSAKRYLVTAAAVAIAALLRWLLDPLLGDNFPFLTFFIAVIFAAWYGGWRAALLAANLGFFLSLYLFIPPRYSFFGVDTVNAIGLAIYMLVCVIMAGFAELMRRSQVRTEVAEQRAIQQAETLQTTFDSIGDAVITTDRVGNITYLNAVAEALTGWTNEDANGKSLTIVFNIINEQTRQTVENPALRALKEGVSVGLANHTILITKNGLERHIDDCAAPIKSKAGEIIGCVLVFRDVSAKVEAEIKLRERTAILRAISVHSQDLIFVKDRDCRMVFANPATLSVIGLSEPEVLGTTEADRSSVPAEAQAILENDRRIMASGKAEVLEEIFTSAGKVRIYQSSKIPMLDDTGVVVGIIGIARDITEQKLQAKAMRDSEERLRMALSAARMVAWRIDPVTGNVIHSDNATEVLGLHANAIDGINQGFELVHPDDVGQHRAIIEKALAEHGSYVSQYRFIRPNNGEVMWLEERGQALVDGPEDAVRLSGVVMDISEIKHVEEQFRVMAENIPQLAWMAHSDGNIYWYNRRWYEYTGTNPESQIGWGWESVHDPQILPAVIESWNKSLKTGEPFDMVFPLKSSTGEFHPFLTRVMPVKNADGEVIQWFGTNTDITEQTHTAENLRKLSAELSEADRRKDEFLATLAHELRNPLAPIRNGLQILRLSGGTGEEAEQARVMMERQINQMVHLVDDLMDVSRISSGKLELRTERIELAAVLNDAVETSRPLIESQGHQVKINFLSQPLMIDADITRLVQVFANLINNACKYSERGGLITLNAKCEGSDVVVAVIDTGVGIPKEMLPKIFELFAQVDGSLERSQGGLGIGLTLVKRLVEMHGGTIEANSEGVGKGSEFTVRLPLAITPEQAVAPKNVPQDSMVTPRRCRVLVADDNKDAAITLAMLLKLMGCEVRKAHDGLEAVNVAADFLPELILLDIGMPKLNGYEACRRIREQPWGEKIVIVALTGWGQDEDKRLSQVAGFTHHIVKPVNPRAIEALLADLSVSNHQN